MSGAAAHHHRKRRRDCARDSSSSPTRRRRRRQLSGASSFPAVRPFCIRFVVAAARRRRGKRLRSDSHLASTACLRRHRSASSVAVPSRFPALRPFVLRYILAAGTSAPRLRRKPAVVVMGNFFSWISGNSTGNDGLEVYRGLVKGSREVGDLTVATKALVNRPKEDLAELFTPLTNKEETEVKNLLYGSGYSKHILVMHEPSNIDITLEKLRCLRPRGWLNDEVINLYLELLKERADREPERFLKCHFFNTFFYKKLVCGKNGYDYDSVRRWTTLKKLGYGLAECDKIFVPLHRDIHWRLVVIDMKGRTIQYLDSLGGIDHAVLRILARYIMDELKDKSNIEIDTSFLLEEVPDSLPLQQNWSDCGMFMLKFIDFHSRGLVPSFSQEHMEYFRKRTTKEILRLRAD